MISNRLRAGRRSPSKALPLRLRSLIRSDMAESLSHRRAVASFRRHSPNGRFPRITEIQSGTLRLGGHYSLAKTVNEIPKPAIGREIVPRDDSKRTAPLHSTNFQHKSAARRRQQSRRWAINKSPAAVPNPGIRRAGMAIRPGYSHIHAIIWLGFTWPYGSAAVERRYWF